MEEFYTFMLKYNVYINICIYIYIHMEDRILTCLLLKGTIATITFIDKKEPQNLSSDMYIYIYIPWPDTIKKPKLHDRWVWVHLCRLLYHPRPILTMLVKAPWHYSPICQVMEVSYPWVKGWFSTWLSWPSFGRGSFRAPHRCDRRIFTGWWQGGGCFETFPDDFGVRAKIIKEIVNPKSSIFWWN